MNQEDDKVLTEFFSGLFTVSKHVEYLNTIRDKERCRQFCAALCKGLIGNGVANLIAGTYALSGVKVDQDLQDSIQKYAMSKADAIFADVARDYEEFNVSKN